MLDGQLVQSARELCFRVTLSILFKLGWVFLAYYSTRFLLLLPKLGLQSNSILGKCSIAFGLLATASRSHSSRIYPFYTCTCSCNAARLAAHVSASTHFAAATKRQTRAHAELHLSCALGVACVQLACSGVCSRLHRCCASAPPIAVEHQQIHRS